MPATRRVVRAAALKVPCGFPLAVRRPELAELAGRLAGLRDESVSRQLAALELAARLGAALAILPELFGSPYFPVDADPVWRELAEDAQEGATVRKARDAARRWGLLLVVPIYEWDQASGRRFNTAVVVEADGSVLGAHRKVHFASGTGSHGLAEAFHYDRGDGRQRPRTRENVSRNPYFQVLRTSVGRLGVTLGEDRRLPGTLETLSREGAEIVASPHAATDPEARRLWDAECVVDAARHALYVGTVNRGGREEPWGREYFEQAGWYGPQGKLPDESPIRELAVSDLDLAALLQETDSPLRQGRDRRPETYTR